MPEEFASDSMRLVEKIESDAGTNQPRLLNYVAALKESLRHDAQAHEESQKLLAEYETAYAKLTAPANRIGVFLRLLGEEESGRPGSPIALIVLGDSEYVVEIDPNLDHDRLVSGDRVCLNEAYAIVNILPASTAGRIEKVGDVLKDGRIQLGDGIGNGGKRLIDRIDSLRNEAIRPGDEVRLDPSGRLAVEVHPVPPLKDYALEEVPELPWEKIGGQTEAIALIRETIEQPLLFPELFAKFDKKPIKGVLLYGPPGCGKTLIGKATAYNLTREYSKRLGRPVTECFLAISGPKILNMWLGETERMVREIFSTARQKAAEGHLVFIFMDEAESILRTRSSGRWLSIANTVVPQFCAELDGLKSLENVVLILTSNRPDYIDPAILRPERIDRKIKVTRPDRLASIQILNIYLHDQIPLDPAVLTRHKGDAAAARKQLIEAFIDEFWATTKANEFLRINLKSGRSETLYCRDIVSGALLKSVVDRAKDFAIQRAIQNPTEDTGVGSSDLTAAMRKELKENEIFPKSDLTEDWLELLDHPAENVASVRPIGRSKGEQIIRKNII